MRARRLCQGMSRRCNSMPANPNQLREPPYLRNGYFSHGLAELFNERRQGCALSFKLSPSILRRLPWPSPLHLSSTSGVVAPAIEHHGISSPVIWMLLDTFTLARSFSVSSWTIILDCPRIALEVVSGIIHTRELGGAMTDWNVSWYVVYDFTISSKQIHVRTCCSGCRIWRRHRGHDTGLAAADLSVPLGRVWRYFKR
ncbi:hypothetical protein BKA93DRAFT_259895 [Sparassis latifolia]